MDLNNLMSWDPDVTEYNANIIVKSNNNNNNNNNNDNNKIIIIKPLF